MSGGDDLRTELERLLDEQRGCYFASADARRRAARQAKRAARSLAWRRKVDTKHGAEPAGLLPPQRAPQPRQERPQAPISGGAGVCRCDPEGRRCPRCQQLVRLFAHVMPESDRQRHRVSEAELAEARVRAAPLGKRWPDRRERYDLAA